MTKPARGAGPGGAGARPGLSLVPPAGKPPHLSTQAAGAAAERRLPKLYSVTSEPSEVNKKNFLTPYSILSEDTICQLFKLVFSISRWHSPSLHATFI